MVVCNNCEKKCEKVVKLLCNSCYQAYYYRTRVNKETSSKIFTKYPNWICDCKPPLFDLKSHDQRECRVCGKERNK